MTTMLPVDEACALTEHILERMSEGNEIWNKITLKDAECFLSHAERDGVAWKSGPGASERPQRAKKSTMCFRFKVLERMSNPFGTMHGGCIATMMDLLSSFVLLLHSSGEAGKPWTMMGVSQTLNVQYIAPARVGTWVEVEVRSSSVGRVAALLQLDMYELDGRDGQRIVHTGSGTHTKIDVMGPAPKL